MTESLSISKSVTRAFRVLELFREQHRSMTAAEIGRRLGVPQPSIRALLKNLVRIGYLDYTAGDRTYRPTPKVITLGDWLPATGRVPAALLRATEAIAILADETTSLCTTRDGNVEVLHVKKAEHPVALQLEPGVGIALWRTAVGRTLLAQYDDAALDSTLATLLRREKTTAGRRTLQALPRELRRIRTAGYFAGYDLFLKGVGAVCVPVPRGTPHDDTSEQVPLVLAVAGLRDRIQPRESQLLRLIRAELRRSS